MPESEKSLFTIKKAREDFLAIWPNIKTILGDVDEDNIDDAVNWLNVSLEHNVRHGKMIRGVLAISSFLNFSKDETVKAKLIEKAYMLGWSIEILQGACLVADDLMDQSITRRGKDCWYKKENVGMQAVNDAFMLAYGAMRIIKAAFYETEFYQPLMEVVNEVCYKTTLGQNLDSQVQDIEKFRMDRYLALVKYKTSYYSFYGPVMAGRILAGVDKTASKEDTDRLTEILLEIGLMFQAQDDMLDAFGDPKVTGKVGTDIPDKKCTWILATYLESASEAEVQRIKTLYENAEVNEGKIKAAFREFDMEQKFETFVLQKSAHIKDLCNQLENQDIAKLLKGLLALLNSRKR